MSQYLFLNFLQTKQNPHERALFVLIIRKYYCHYSLDVLTLESILKRVNKNLVMNLKSWLKKEGKTHLWLSQQLEVSRSRVTQVVNSEEIPLSWIPAILRITNHEVSIDDKWRELWQVGPKKNKKRNANLGVTKDV